VIRDRGGINANHGYEARTRPSVFRLTMLAARVLLFPFFRVHTEGLTGLPRTGSFLLLPKHQRWEDVPLLGMSAGRPLYYVAKHELFETPLSRWFITSLGGIPLNRKRPMESRSSIKALWGLLHRGEGIVIFPEGTYYRGTMGPGRSGLLRMILSRMDLPCIPVGIRYFKGRFPKPVRIVFGKPILWKQGADGLEFYERIMREVARLSDLDIPGT
jgi:1-acyl-sn-glycerol-3-phosphate acyltransferase